MCDRNPAKAKPMQALSNSTDPDALFMEAEAANFLNLSIRTLQSWRVKGGGPLFVRAGRAVRYRRRDLLAWMDSNTRDSTSATKAPGPDQ
jgi:hypothetical protein